MDMPDLDSNRTALLTALDRITEAEEQGYTLTRIVVLAEFEDDDSFERWHVYRGFTDAADFAGYLMAHGARHIADAAVDQGGR